MREVLPKTGAVCAQFVRCGKARCRCARGELHGPYYYRFTREPTAKGWRQRKAYIRKSEAEAELAEQRESREWHEAARPFIEAARGPSLLDAMLKKIIKWRL